MSVPQKITQPKTIRVAPIVSDPVMRNSKGPAEMLLNDELGVDSDIKDTVFGNTAKKTKEETDSGHNGIHSNDHNSGTSQPETNTIVLVAFALIVIALVAIIVWMVMRNSGDKKEEEEVRRMILPHPRNGMPPNQMYSAQHRQQPSYNRQQEGMSLQQMEQMHRQQQMMQQQMAQMNRQMGGDRNEPSSSTPKEDSDEVAVNAGNDNEDDTEATDDTNTNADDTDTNQPTFTTVNISQRKPAGFADAMAKLDSKVASKPALDSSNKPKFTKAKPHPSIIRPTVPSDVDEVMAKTTAMLKAGAAKSTEDASMSELDRALLDRVNSNTELDENDTDE